MKRLRIIVNGVFRPDGLVRGRIVDGYGGNRKP